VGCLWPCHRLRRFRMQRPPPPPSPRPPSPPPPTTPRAPPPPGLPLLCGLRWLRVAFFALVRPWPEPGCLARIWTRAFGRAWTAGRPLPFPVAEPPARFQASRPPCLRVLISTALLSCCNVLVSELAFPLASLVPTRWRTQPLLRSAVFVPQLSVWYVLLVAYLRAPRWIPGIRAEAQSGRPGQRR